MITVGIGDPLGALTRRLFDAQLGGVRRTSRRALGRLCHAVGHNYECRESDCTMPDTARGSRPIGGSGRDHDAIDRYPHHHNVALFDKANQDTAIGTGKSLRSRPAARGSG